MRFLWDDLKKEFNKGDHVIRIILVNVVVFIILILVKLIFFLLGYAQFELEAAFYQYILSWLAIPYNLGDLIIKPWTLISYMFLHSELGHIFWNMLILYWFGKLFREYLGDKKVLPVYIWGGVSGAVLSILLYNILPSLNAVGILMGASASVYAIMLAITTLIPNHKFNLILIGPVSLKYIASFSIIFDVLAITSFSNTGGHLAHLGGGLLGFLYVYLYRNKGIDLSKGFNRMWHKITQFKIKRSKLNVAHSQHRKSISDDEYNEIKISKQKAMDAILDKISKSGYESLTKEEKELLFRISNEDQRKS